MKRLRWLCAVTLLVAGSAVARDLPTWSVEIKGGRFTPETEDWSTFFDDSVTCFEVGVAYKPVRQIELAVNAGYLQARGHGFAPLHGTVIGDAHYELFPVHAAVLWRAVFSEEQLLVPYIGGGWTRFGYRQQIEHQSDITGSADGYHLRGGLQVLLDRIDSSNASALGESIGVKNSYFFLEFQRTEVTKAGVDLGGSATLGGLLFEF